MTTETNEERLARIAEYVDLALDTGNTSILNFGDLNWLIAMAQLAELQKEYIDGKRKA